LAITSTQASIIDIDRRPSPFAMHFTKKIDRARQWAGEKMGGEARTSLTDEFKALEAEMSLRQEGELFLLVLLSTRL
jgi:hypothetical protein